MPTAPKSMPSQVVEIPVSKITKEFLLNRYGYGKEPLNAANSKFLRHEFERTKSQIKIGVKNKAHRYDDKVMIKILLLNKMNELHFSSDDLYQIGKSLDLYVADRMEEGMEVATLLVKRPGTGANLMLIKYDLDPVHETNLRQTSQRLRQNSPCFSRQRTILEAL